MAIKTHANGGSRFIRLFAERESVRETLAINKANRSHGISQAAALFITHPLFNIKLYHLRKEQLSGARRARVGM
jgi:hypothetical protein